MSFFMEIGKVLGLDYIKEANGYNIINYNGSALYIEGIRRIVKLSDEEIIVNSKHSAITVTGAELSVAELENNCMIIKGQIKSVSAEGGQTKIGQKDERKDSREGGHEK